MSVYPLSNQIRESRNNVQNESLTGSVNQEDIVLIKPRTPCLCTLSKSIGRYERSEVLKGVPSLEVPEVASLATPHHDPQSARLARSRRTRCNRGCGTCVVGLFHALGAAVVGLEEMSDEGGILKQATS